MLRTMPADGNNVKSVTPISGTPVPEIGGFPPDFPRYLLRPAQFPESAVARQSAPALVRHSLPLVLAALALSLLTTGCLAADEEAIEPKSAPVYVEPLQGLVIDRTITFFGRDFYGRFMDAWREQPDSGKIDLAIIERPDPRFGSEITIEADRKVEFRAFLSPTRARTRALAESAAAMLAQRLVLTPEQRRAAEGPDLAMDEM